METSSKHEFTIVDDIVGIKPKFVKDRQVFPHDYINRGEKRKMQCSREYSKPKMGFTVSPSTKREAGKRHILNQAKERIIS